MIMLVHKLYALWYTGWARQAIMTPLIGDIHEWANSSQADIEVIILSITEIRAVINQRVDHIS